MTHPLFPRMIHDRLAGSADLVSRVLSRHLPGAMPAHAARPSLEAGALTHGAYTGRAGTRPYQLFVPDTLPRAPGLVVMLHGCGQTATDFAAGTRMNLLACKAGFLVLYPEQVAEANRQRCWNWFNPAGHQREGGEAGLIAGMAGTVASAHGVASRLVFAAGLSAGGAQAAILGAAFPDVFAAIGVHSGLACGAASDLPGALMAMARGHAGQGRLATRAIIFHGDRDTTVNPRNAGHVADQVDGDGLVRTVEGQVPGGLSYTRTMRGRTLERWVVHGLGHAWSGGSREGSFTEPAGPDASLAMVDFFMA